MKTIKIFLASSEELDNDRMAFGNLVRRLDDMYEKRGIRIKLFEWEDYDAAFNDRRKQDEYNNYVRQSDVFLALFHKKAGKFTIEEFNVASEEFKTKTSPKVYTYCKDLQPGEEETPELIEFKKHLFDEMGHYWCRYDSRESLQLQFVMQLQLVESSQMPANYQVKVIRLFMDASYSNPLFHDTEHELTLSYYVRADCMTRFSLDTDWRRANVAVMHELQRIKAGN